MWLLSWGVWFEMDLGYPGHCVRGRWARGVSLWVGGGHGPVWVGPAELIGNHTGFSIFSPCFHPPWIPPVSPEVMEAAWMVLGLPRERRGMAGGRGGLGSPGGPRWSPHFPSCRDFNGQAQSPLHLLP